MSSGKSQDKGKRSKEKVLKGEGSKAQEVKEAREFTSGFSQGFEKGFKAGVEIRPDIKNIQRISFDNGVRHIVSLSESFLVKELGLPDRDRLADDSSKIPTWWLATLLKNYRPSAVSVDEQERL